MLPVRAAGARDGAATGGVDTGALSRAAGAGRATVLRAGAGCVAAVLRGSTVAGGVGRGAGVTGSGIVETGADDRCAGALVDETGRDGDTVGVGATVGGAEATNGGAGGALAARAAGVHCRP
jgi:hypothetical protein